MQARANGPYLHVVTTQGQGGRYERTPQLGQDTAERLALAKGAPEMVSGSVFVGVARAKALIARERARDHGWCSLRARTTTSVSTQVRRAG